MTRRRPQTWTDRFLASLEGRPSPALESWRWAREGEDPVDPRAVEAAWDLVTLAASAEASKVHHAMRLLPTDVQRTLFPALVVAGARVSEVGAFRVVDPEGKPWFPRDLAFVPGREHLTPDLELRCLVEEGRNLIDFHLWYRTSAWARVPDDAAIVRDEPSGSGGATREVTVERGMAILLGEGPVGRTTRADERHRDIELQQEGLLVVRYDRGDIWRDPIGCAEDALRTLTETARFDCAATVTELERT